MVTRETLCGVMWRIAPMGTTQVYYAGLTADGTQARVHGAGQREKWARRPLLVSPADVFFDREEARAEYRARHKVALAADPYASRNVTRSA